MSSFKHFKPYEGTSPYIFISYAHADSAEVLPIVADMHEHGYNIWYDEGIEVGSEWQECIASHLVDAHLVIAFISNAYMSSDNCRREMHYALSKRKKVINVFIQETQMTPGMEMQIGNIFALMKYTFPGEQVFYDKLYSAPLLLSENFFAAAGAPQPAPRSQRDLKAERREAHRQEKLRRKAEKKKPEAKKKRKKIVGWSIALLIVALLVAATLVAYFTGYLERFLTETKTVVDLPDDTVAEFREPLLEAAAREYSGIADGSITVADLKGMTALYICGDRYWLNEPGSVFEEPLVGVTEAEITDWQGQRVSVSVGEVDQLDDLQYFTSLRTLHLQFQTLNSLESLPVCGIETLDISGCRVTSLQGISDLPELRSITANGYALTDLGDLNACLKLTSVSFVGGRVSNYSAFTALNQIRSVTFSNSAAVDFKHTLDHSSLRSAAFYGCDLSGRFFNKFDNEDAIISLDFTDCVLENLDGIQEFANLSELTLCRCTGVSDYSPLRSMTALKTVYADPDTAAELEKMAVSFKIEIIKD